MKTLKLLLARLARYLDEVNARHKTDGVPTREHIREMAEAIRQSRAELAEGAVRNGLR